MTLQFVDGNKSLLQNIIRIISISCSLKYHLTSHQAQQETNKSPAPPAPPASFPNMSPASPGQLAVHVWNDFAYCLGGRSRVNLTIRSLKIKISVKLTRLILKSIQNGFPVKGWNIIHFGFRPILGNSKKPALAAPVEDGMMFWEAHRPPLQSCPVPPTGLANLVDVAGELRNPLTWKGLENLESYQQKIPPTNQFSDFSCDEISAILINDWFKKQIVLAIFSEGLINRSHSMRPSGHS